MKSQAFIWEECQVTEEPETKSLQNVHRSHPNIVQIVSRRFLFFLFLFPTPPFDQLKQETNATNHTKDVQKQRMKDQKNKEKFRNE